MKEMKPMLFTTKN